MDSKRLPSGESKSIYVVFKYSDRMLLRDKVLHGCKTTKVRQFGYLHLGYRHLVIVKKLTDGNLTESIASIAPYNLNQTFLS